jgi:hypothetical protein
MNNFNYSLTELEHMIPWERQIYTSLLIEHIKKENERTKQNQASGRF